MSHIEPSPTVFTPLDMLMPARLLDETDWRGNPLVVYSQRRARRPLRFILTRLLELLLIASFALLVAWCFYDVLENRQTVPVSRWFEVFLSTPYDTTLYPYSALPRSRFLIPEDAIGWLLACSTFLLLRYHLHMNDQSNHLKTLSRARLGELLLTHLGNDDYFLHHFLMFCRHYRVLVAWAAVWGVFMATDMVSGGIIWFQPDIYARLLMTLQIILMVWVAGVAQYAIEWRLFAGRDLKFWRKLLSLAISLALTGFVLLSAGTGVRDPSLPGRMFASVLVPAFVAAITYVGAIATGAKAVDILRQRFDPVQPARRN